jgi:hypothetical protein
MLAELDPGPVQRLMDAVAARGRDGDWLAQLEWDIVAGEKPTPAALRRLMELLGAGLPGVMVGSVGGLKADDATQARAVAVASVLPDTVRLPGDWPMSAHQAAELARRRLLALVTTDLTPAAWLALTTFA